MTDKLIYLASPYSHEDMKVCRERFERICFVAARLMEKGLSVYSPIAHTHPIAIHGGLDHLDHDFWMNIDEVMLDRCDELWVYTMDGWRDSRGVEMEVEYMTYAEKPVWYVDDIDKEWRLWRLL